MKLTNPTDDQLNAAFAKIIVGMEWHRPTREEIQSGGYYSYSPDFTRSADAVLPWLAKRDDVTICQCCTWRRDDPRRAKEQPLNGWHVMFGQSRHDEMYDDDNDWLHASDASFAKAAVIALLRAHGVEVSFT